jgi:hypothetical protein
MRKWQYTKESDVPKTRTRKSFIKKVLMGKKNIVL